VRTHAFATFFVPLLAAGCLQTLAVNQTAGIIVTGGAALREETDLEYAEQAVPGGLVTIEGLWRNVPDNEELLLQLAQGYSGYAFGFIEDRAEEAAARGDVDEADHQYRRARRFYLRGRRYAFYLLELEHEGFREMVKRPLPEFERYLQEEMDEDDVPGLFWAAYGWASAINVSLDDIAMVADVSTALALVHRVLELDPTYFDHSPVLFMANVYSAFPEALGATRRRAGSSTSASSG